MTVERAKELIGKEGAVFVKSVGTCTIAYVDYDYIVLVKYVTNSLKQTKWLRLDELEEVEIKNKKELESIIKNYQKVINELMGTQLTDTEEVGRLINIAHYQKWEEL